MTETDLDALRKALDDIDAVLVSALAERAKLAREIAGVKSLGTGPVRDVEREAALLRDRTALAERLGLEPTLVRRLFLEIMDDSRRRQHEVLQSGERVEEILVGYQGTEGAYGHQAACRHFGVSTYPVTLKPYPSFTRLVEAVQRGDVARGVLPVENTTAGSVAEAYDLLLRFNVAVVGEEVLEIRHCLVGVADVPLETIRRVHSHPQALAQCSEFVAGLDGVDEESSANTALAAARVAALNDPSQAAIASEDAAVYHGLRVLRRDIANQTLNYTRFLVLAAEPQRCDPRIAAKVSVLFGTPHARGALAACLNVLSEAGISLLKLESRPRPGRPWEYVFHADLEGHQDAPDMRGALQLLESTALFVKVLGCYPARDLPGRAT